MVTRACYTLILVLLLASSAQSVPVEVNSRVALGGNDFIDWGTLGPQNTVLQSPFPVNSTGGISAVVSQTGNLTGNPIFQRIDQSSGWSGNFAPGDALIWNQENADHVFVQFSIPVAGVGAQVQSNFFGNFTMALEVFDSGNNLLGSFSENGNSNANADNSAIFLGALNDTANIDHINYILSGIGGGFAMNQLDLVTDGQLAPIPEPGTILLLATSLTGLGVAGWRKHVKRQ